MSEEFASAGNYPAGSDAWSGQPRKVAITLSEIQEGFTPNTPVPAPIVNYLLAVAYPDVQVFDANGTWAKPEGSLFHHVKMIGLGGGSGDGGAQGGGGGGSSGELREEWILAEDMPDTAAITITGLVDPISGNTGMCRLAGGSVQIDARPGYNGSNGTGSVGGAGGSLAPELETGAAGAGGNAAVGAPGKGMLNSSKFAGGGGGDTTFAGGAGGRGDCNLPRGPQSAGLPGLGGRGYGAGAGGGAGGDVSGGGGGSGGGGIGTQLLAPTGGFAVGVTGGTGNFEGAPGVVIVTTWRGLP